MSDLSINTVSVSPVVAARLTADVKSAANVDESVSSRVNSLVKVSDFVANPKGVVDPKSGFYVLQYRDGSTGEVTQQYPSAKVVDAYKSSEASLDSPKSSAKPASTGGSHEGSVEVAQPTSSGSTSSVGSTSVGSTSTGTTPSVGQGSTGSASIDA